SPALQLKRLLVGRRRRDGDFFLQHQVLRPTGVRHRVLARLQRHRLAVGPVNLRVEAEVRRQAAALRGVDAGAVVPEGERAHHRAAVAAGLAVVVQDVQLDDHGGGRLEQVGYRVAARYRLAYRPGNFLAVAPLDHFGDVAHEVEGELRLLAAGV